MNKQNGNSPLDTENKLMVVKGEREGGEMRIKNYCLGAQSQPYASIFKNRSLTKLPLLLKLILLMQNSQVII